MPEISSEMKIQYLKWWSIKANIESCRKLFYQLIRLPNPNKNLFQYMIELEITHYNGIHTINNIRKLHHKQCLLNGKNDVGK